MNNKDGRRYPVIGSGETIAEAQSDEAPPRRRHNPAWRDNTRAERQAKRLAALNEAAQAAGFETWRRLETAVVNGAKIFK